MERLRDTGRQREMRQHAAAFAPRFSDGGVADWLAQSIDAGRPVDSRFHEAFAGYGALASSA
jgi:hypothetical protein